MTRDAPGQADGLTAGTTQAWRHLPEERLRKDPASLGPDELRQLAEDLQLAHLEATHHLEQLRLAHDEVASACDSYRMLFEHAPIGYLILDDQGRMAHLNVRAAELLGAAPDALQGTRLAERLHPASQEDWAAYLQALNSRMARRVAIRRLQVILRLPADPDAGGRLVQCQAVPEPGSSEGGGAQYRVALVEVTEVYRTLEQRDQLLQALEAAPILFGLADADGRVHYQNPTFDREVGQRPGAPYGTVDDYHPIWAARKVREQALPEAARHGMWQGETAILRADGSCAPAFQTVVAYRDWQGDLGTYATIVQELTPVRSLESLLYQDPLTELPNRMLFLDRVEQALLRQAKDGDGVAVIVLDVWDFRSVNNALGNEAGDSLLHRLGQRLASTVGEADTVARIGADAFAILRGRIADPEEAARLAGELIEAAQASCTLGGLQYTVQVHVGISICFAQEGQDRRGAQTLLEQADSARREAEDEGRSYRFYDARLAARDLERMTLTTELRRALDADQLAVHYQPQVDLETGHWRGLEALVRWEHPERGFISPARFIPMAEDSGLIGRLGAWVLERACREYQALHTQGCDWGRLAVNVTAPELGDPAFPDRVLGTLERTGLPPERLELEITERLWVGVDPQTVDALERLRRHGVSVAVDDFGTGYSALSYLKDLPVDHLKVDRSFIQTLDHDARGATLTRAILTLAHSLELEVLAEGIETAEQERFLRKAGCQLGQGFRYARPAPLDKLRVS